MTLVTATPVGPNPNSLDLLSQYREFWRQSRRMQDAAGNGEWDLLVALELDRAAINQSLFPQVENCSFSPQDQALLAEMIRDILASDAQTKSLVVPRQQELKETFGSIDTEKKLQKAYAVTW